MDVFSLFAKILLDTSEYDKGLAGAKGKLSTFGNALKTGFSTMAKVCAAALTATSAAAVGFTKSAIDASIRYEDAFTGVMKTVEETGTTSYEKLSDAIKQMSTETASSQEEIAGVMEAAGQLGIVADDITGFTKTMVMLGDTTNLSADEAAVALAHFTNITGESSDNVDRLGASIVDLGNNFATDEAAIVNMSTRLASAGTIAGLTSTDILALSTAMSSVGINAEAGGTAMSQTLATIKKATELAGSAADADGVWAAKLEALAGVAGMSGDEFKKAWGDDAVHTLSKFIKGLSDAEASGSSAIVMLDELGMTGIRQSNMLQALGLASDVLNNAIETSTNAYKDNTALLEEANKRYGTIRSQLNQLASAWKNLQIAFGDSTGKSGLKDFIDYAKTGITTLTEAYQKNGVSGFVESFGSVLSEGLTLIVSKTPEFIDAGFKLLGAIGKGLVDNAPQIFSSLEQVGGILLTNLNTLAEIAIEGLEKFDWKAEASKLADKIVSLFDPTNDRNALTQLGENAVKIIEQLTSGLGEAASVLLPAAMDLIAQFGQFLIDEAPGLIDAGIDMINGIIEGLTDPEAIQKLIETSVILLETIAESLIKNAPKYFSNMIDLTIALWTGIGKAIAHLSAPLVEKGKEIAGKLKEGITKMFTELKEAAGNLITKVKDGIEAKKNAVTNAVNRMWETITNIPVISGFIEFVTSSFTTIKETLTGIFDGIKQAAESFWKVMENIFGGAVLLIIDVVTGDFEQLKTDLDKIWTNIKNAATGMWEGLKTSVESLVDGLTTQVKYTFTAFGDVIANIWTNVKNTAISTWETLKSKVVSTVTNLVSSVRSKISELPGIIREKVNDAISFLRELPGKAFEWGKDMIGNFIQGIKDKAQELKDAISGIGDRIRDRLGHSHPKVGALADDYKWMPDMMQLFAKGIKDNENLVIKQIEKSFDFSDMVPTLSADTSVKSGAYGTAGNTYGAITININGYNKDKKELAQEVANIINRGVNRAQAVYA